MRQEWQCCVNENFDSFDRPLGCLDPFLVGTAARGVFLFQLTGGAAGRTSGAGEGGSSIAGVEPKVRRNVQRHTPPGSEPGPPNSNRLLSNLLKTWMLRCFLTTNGSCSAFAKYRARGTTSRFTHPWLSPRHSSSALGVEPARRKQPRLERTRPRPWPLPQTDPAPLTDTGVRWPALQQLAKLPPDPLPSGTARIGV